jgi:hypothetical protein
MMLLGWSLSQEISHQSLKNVFGRIIPTNLQKLLIVFYGLLKMTQGCHPLALDSEPTKTPIKTISSCRSNYTQCFNIPPSQQFALVIKQLLLQVNLTISNKFVAVVFEKHLHYVDQYADMLEAKMEWMEFANKIRIQLFVVKTIKGFGKKQYKEMEAALIDAIFNYNNWPLHHLPQQ